MKVLSKIKRKPGRQTIEVRATDETYFGTIEFTEERDIFVYKSRKGRWVYEYANGRGERYRVK